MSQFLGVNVIVVNGSAVVRAVWRARIGTRTGTFQAGEDLKWPGAGGSTNAKYLSDTGSNGEIRFWMTVETPEPVVGDTIYGVTSTATAPITLLEPVSFPDWAGNPPRFADSPSQGPVATNDILVIANEVVGLVGSTPGIKRHNVTLAANWGGNTYDHTTAGTYPLGAPAVFARDRTGNYALPLLKASDRLSGSVFSEAMRRLDTALAAGAGGGPPSAWTNLTLTSPWINEATEAVSARSYAPNTDSVRLKGVIHNNAIGVSTGASILSGGNALPSGSRPSENLRFDAGGGQYIMVRTDGTITYEGPGITAGTDWTTRLVLNHIEFRADGS